MIKMARNLSMPVDAVTQTHAFIGRKASGKTYAAGRLVEQVYASGAPVVVLDPVGNWYGLRLAADGKKPGLPIPVFGGEHGDVPLAPDAGAVVGRMIMERRLSAVLDVSSFRKADRKRFVTSLSEELFHRAKKIREPLLVVLEEAQVFAPQHAAGDDARMLGTIEDIVRLGRNYGLGSVMISQRPQSVNKEVLNQVECLFVGQLSGAHERKAVDQWIVAAGADEAEGYVSELPALETGEMFVWSPSWLRTFQKVKILKKQTFDASATPQIGGRRKRTGKMAEVDLAELTAEVEATIERARAEDPAVLRRRIAELERELRMVEKTMAEKVEPERVQVPVVRVEAVDALERIREEVRGFGEVVQNVLDEVQRMQPVADRSPSPVTKRPAAARPTPRTNGQRVSMAKGLRRMLVALAQRPGLTRKQLALRAGISSRSGTFSTYLSRARTSGWVQGSTQFWLTDEGLTALGHYDPLPEGAALLDYWKRNVRGGASRMLDALAEAYPSALDRSELGERAEISSGSGTFSTYLSRLRGLELVEGSSSIRLSEELVD